MLNHDQTRENAFFFLTLVLCVIVLWHFLFPFAFGITFAFLLEPLVEKILLAAKLNRPAWKWVISIACTFVTLALIFGPFLTLVSTAIQELVGVISLLQSKSDSPNILSLGAEKISTLMHHFGLNYNSDEIILRSKGLLNSMSRGLLVDIGSVLSATPQFILKTAVLILTWVFFLVHGKQWRQRFLVKIFPWTKERELIANTCSSILRALIVANVLVAFVQSFLITITLASFGIPRFILLGMIAFFASFIPIIGTAPLMLSASAWCYFSQDRPIASICILICGVLISLLDNVLRPYFMKGSTEISFYWIFLSIISGLAMFGIPGAVLGPLIFALFAGALQTLEISHEK